uniref:Uncharacterized protein n=2 Tax=Brassica oleracea TaxID=3712 RepID=A0A0D3CAA6_BRAOL
RLWSQSAGEGEGVRLLFEDQRVPSKCRKKQGLKRSWVVLDPKRHPTVSEFSDHLLCLFEACPHGISLSMDGFVLPPFESSRVLKDKDIVWRKKCKLAATEESPVERENEAVVSKGNAVKKRKKSDAQRTENDEQNVVNAKPKTKSKKSSQQAESEQCNMSGETKKTPSRSARLKKAKRQWLREKTKQEKEEIQQKQVVVAPSQKPAFTTNHRVTKENRSEALETQQPDESGDGVGDEVVPVEVRPGQNQDCACSQVVESKSLEQLRYHRSSQVSTLQASDQTATNPKLSTNNGLQTPVKEKETLKASSCADSQIAASSSASLLALVATPFESTSSQILSVSRLISGSESMSSSSRIGALRFNIQQNLIEDNVRAGAYYASVMENKLDFSGCVVLHVGAGSGVLALCAAQAGAKHVYLVEASEYALKLIDENPTLSELITVIEGNVEDVALPEKPDVLISEPLGMHFTHGFNERGLKSYVIARDRFISPNGKMLGKMFPSAGRIHIAPFTDEFLFTEMANKPVVDGFDKSLLVAHPMIHTIDFTQKKEGDFYVMDMPLLFISSTSTMVHGLALWFEVLLDGSVDKRWIKTSPRAPTTDCFRIRCVFPHAVDVVIGQSITGRARFEALTDQSYTIDITLTAEMFGRGGSKIGYQSYKSKFELCQAQQVTPLPPKDETEDDWYSQFQYGAEDNFHGFFIPWDLLQRFLSAEDAKSSMVVGILVGTEQHKVTHILLPPQWSRQGELHISDIPLEDMHLQGTTLIGYLRTEASCEITPPTAADVRFLSKHFGKEAIVGICSSWSTPPSMAFYKLTEEAFVATSWKLDEKTSVLFLVPRGGIWNYNTCVNNRWKNMPYRLRVSSLPKAYLGC